MLLISRPPQLPNCCSILSPKRSTAGLLGLFSSLGALLPPHTWPDEGLGSRSLFHSRSRYLHFPGSVQFPTEHYIQCNSFCFETITISPSGKKKSCIFAINVPGTDTAAPAKDKSFGLHYSSLQKFWKQLCRVGKRSLVAAWPLEDSAGTAMLACCRYYFHSCVQASKKGNGLHGLLHFYLPPPPLGLKILKLRVGKIPDKPSEIQQRWSTSVLWLTSSS